MQDGVQPDDQDADAVDSSFLSRRERRQAEREGRLVPELAGADELAAPPVFETAPVPPAPPLVPTVVIPPTAPAEPSVPSAVWAPPVGESPVAEEPVGEPIPRWAPPPAEPPVAVDEPVAAPQEAAPDPAASWTLEDAPAAPPPAEEEQAEDSFDPFAELGFTSEVPPLAPPPSPPAEEDPFVAPAAAIPLPGESGAQAEAPDFDLSLQTGQIIEGEAPFVPSLLPLRPDAGIEEAPPAAEASDAPEPDPGLEGIPGAAESLAPPPSGLPEPPPLHPVPPDDPAALAVLPPPSEEDAAEPAESAGQQVAAASAPLVTGTSALVDYGDLAKPQPSEWVALLLGIVLPPVGLVASIGAAIRSRRSRGWAIGLNKAAIVVSLVMTGVAAVGGIAVWEAAERARLFQQTVAESAPFCAAATADPALLAPPIYSWPRQGDTIPATIQAMQEFVDRWDGFVPIAPDGIAEGVRSIADRGRELLGGVESSRQVNDVQGAELMLQTIEQSGVGSWVAEYCVAAG